MQTTTLNRPWYLKMAVFFVLFLGFGVYGLYDATVAYPNRGAKYAETRLFEYLKASQTTGPLTSRVSVEQPREELARLRGAQRALSDVERARLNWLLSLEIIGRLTPEHTAIAQPEERFKALEAKWAQGAQPKPLEWYDIPVQWIITAVGFGGAAWLGGLFLAVSRKRYRWDGEKLELTLPEGASVTPADLEDVDKRKWDKYLVFLRVKPSHAKLGGREVKLDLYRYAPLESWVLELERAAFPDRQEEDGDEKEEAPVGGGGAAED
ncbi:MAG: hypothetical protein WD749_06320 [Phycisphaerales bacterium]